MAESSGGECDEANYDFSVVLTKFTLYETRTRFFIVGTNVTEDTYRILKVDRMDPLVLTVTDDAHEYSKCEMTALLKMLDEGNAGLEKVQHFVGIAGASPSKN